MFFFLFVSVHKLILISVLFPYLQLVCAAASLSVFVHLPSFATLFKNLTASVSSASSCLCPVPFPCRPRAWQSLRSQISCEKAPPPSVQKQISGLLPWAQYVSVSPHVCLYVLCESLWTRARTEVEEDSSQAQFVQKKHQSGKY